MCEAAVEGGCLAAPGWPELWRNCSSPAVELLRRGEIPDTEDQCKRQITKALDDLLDLAEPSTEFREVQIGALELIEGQVDVAENSGKGSLVKVCLGQVAGPRAFWETEAPCRMRYGCRKPEGTGMVTETAAQTLGSWSASTFDSPSAMRVARI